jgi:hypothetical protein
MNNRNFKNHFNLGLIFTVFLFLILACDGGVHSKGRILDEHGNPIKGARVFLDVDNEKVKFESSSKEDGSYDLGGTVSPFSAKIRLIVVKDGYQTSLENFDNQEELKGEHNVILKKN